MVDDPEIATRIAQYELAYGMQTSVPEGMDIAREPAHVLAAFLGPLATLLILLGNAVTPGKGYREGPFASQAEFREMVDLVLISRAYEANQKIITTIDQQMQKTLEALG